MTSDEKNRITELRSGGVSYLKIAQTLGLSITLISEIKVRA
jgi:hypothetical protein